MSWIYLYDEDERDLELSRRQLSRYGIEPSLVRSFSNRIDLFEAIDAAQETVVALIDLQSDERNDNNYSGHRVVETIRRHPLLQSRCVPIVYTVHVRDEIIELAHRHGARGFISKHDLEVADSERSEVDLLGFLETQRRRSPLPYGDEADDFPIFPDVQRANEWLKLQEEQLRPALSSVLQGTPRILRRPYFWRVVRYFVDDTDPASVARWIQADLGKSKHSVDSEIEELREHLAPRYLVHGVEWKEFARDLLAKVPQMRRPLAPDELDTVRVLERVGALEEVLHAPAIRSASYLDDRALIAIDRVLSPTAGIGKGMGHVGASKYTDNLLQRLAEVEPDEKARIVLQTDFVRGVTNMYDTYLAQEARA